MRVKRYYFDYAGTTPVDPRVLRAMTRYFDKKFGNPASLHSFGQEANLALNKSRTIIAQALNAKSEKEIIFTGSATESNNLALKGIAFANRDRGNEILISSIEHACVFQSAKWLESQGFRVKLIRVDKYGRIDLNDLKKKISPKTILVSVIHGNNEIGTIQELEKIGLICRKKKVYFHTDAVQSFGKVPLDVQKMKVDLLTASSHKMYGPKGVGCLYVRQGVRIEPLLHGGGQEFGLRSGTVNVSGVVGFAKAVEICQREMEKESRRLTKLRDRIIKTILKRIKGSHLNGHPVKRLPNNISIWFEGIEGEALLMELDHYGISVSTGSACASGKLEPSRVLLAIGLTPFQAHGSLRISLGRWTREKEVDYLLKVLPKAVEKLRRISPFV